MCRVSFDLCMLKRTFNHKQREIEALHSKNIITFLFLCKSKYHNPVEVMSASGTCSPQNSFNIMHVCTYVVGNRWYSKSKHL